MGSSRRKFLIFGLAVLAVATLLGFVLTRQTDDPRILQRNTAKTSLSQTALVDQTPYRTAVSLQNSANTAEEQELATEALRLADREVDIAFASALARAKDTPPAQTKDTAEIHTRIQTIQGRLQSEQAEVNQLTQLTTAKPGRYDATVIQQQLEIGKAQIGLMQDALDDAQQDLIRAGGNPEAEIQQELEEHEGLQQHGNGIATVHAAIKPQTFEVGGSLLSQVRAWLKLRDSERRLREAQQQTNTLVETLNRKHEALEKGLGDNIGLGDSVPDVAVATTPAVAADATQHQARLAKLNKLSENSKTMAAYDKRIDLEKQIGIVYGNWAAVIHAQARLALHAILRSLLWILLAVLFLVIVEGALEHFYVSLGPERRRLGTTRLALRFVSQMIGVFIILLVVFGPPSQLSTVLALAGAGLTVALKDFIVAFFGWFVLMGKHGIHVGDWVEINGIGGEVLEIGLLRTILLETGSWHDTGHPTGQRVSFVNSFAVEGHYFNFTTTGQWMWDELNILIPAGQDPFELTDTVLKLVTDETKSDVAQAEQEWQRVTLKPAMMTFSATPAVEVRPTNLGVNLVIRYVVHAHSRHEVRTKLYQAVVQLLTARGHNQVNTEGVPAVK